MGVRVQLDRGTGFGGRIDHGACVQRIALPGKQEPAGGMPQDVDVRVPQSPHDPLCGLFLRHAKPGVHRGDHQIEFGQEIVFEIQLSIPEDVDLDPLQHADIAP